MCVIGKLNTCPFLTSLRCINSLRILLYSDDDTPYASLAPGVPLVSSSSDALDESESDILVVFFFASLDGTLVVFFEAFTREGEGSLRVIWPQGENKIL